MPTTQIKTPSTTIHLRIRTTPGTYRYAPAAKNKNGSLRAGYCIIDGQPEHYPEAAYAVRYRLSNGKRTFVNVGRDPQEALNALQRRSIQSAAALLERTSSATGPAPAEKAGTDLYTAVQNYLDELELRAAKRTMIAYSKALKGFLVTAEAKTIETVGREDVMRYLTSLKGKVGARTIHNRICVVRALLRRYDRPDIVQKKDLPRYTQKIAEAYTPTQIAGLMQACGKDDRLLFRFFLQSGGREQEVMFATYADLDHDGGLLHIRAKPDLGWTLKDHEERSVPLPDDLLAALAHRREEHPQDRLLFSAPNGSPEGHYLRKLKRIALKAGLNCGHCASKGGQRCSAVPCCRMWELHRFRRTFAYLHHEAGVSLRTLQDWLGHSDIATTQHYIQAADKRSQRTRLQVNSTFSRFTT